MPTRRTIRSLLSVAVLTAGVSGGVAAGWSIGMNVVSPHQPLVPPTIIAVAAPAPIVHVRVPDAPPVIAPAPPPVIDRPKPRPSGQTPMLWPQCVLPDLHPTKTEDVVCTWDRGFPAISGDAKSLAILSTPTDGNGEHYGLEIVFHDSETSRVIGRAEVMSLAELYDATTYEAREKLQEKITHRVAAAQKRLDEGGFRSMTFIGPIDHGEHDGMRTDAVVRGEVSGSAVRLIEQDRVIWQGTMIIPRTWPVRDGEDCDGWTLREQSLYWDSASRTVLSAQRYTTGGCMCGDYDLSYIARRVP